ncbi:TRAP transporter small permease [Alginatibacterium sediminis]|uniref:TRAP transporter small permease protein n=1 Tax=Alginatibacterium sediminis TaxID=2164068 RepID=A0A420E6F6_9ALTE|nr:TRAP transporter small permease [Alginatibacterium sediminis]RKF13736.1 TRAP transporter small permease [Alginatibacterium sediminis]
MKHSTKGSAASESEMLSDAERIPPSNDTLDLAWIDFPGLVFFWILMVVVFLQFFTRYVLNDSLGWTEEVARFLLILVAFCGAITGVRKRTHIFLEFFYRYIPVRLCKYLTIFVELINIGFYSYMAYIGQQLAQQTHQNMVSLPIPKSLIYWAVTVSFAIMAFYSVLWLIHMLKTDGQEVLAEIEKQVINE